VAYIKSNDILDIYKRIDNALKREGPKICREFNVIYQLELSPDPWQKDDPNFVKYYTVDLKKGRLLIA
jgi:hypothetical protein